MDQKINYGCAQVLLKALQKNSSKIESVKTEIVENGFYLEFVIPNNEKLSIIDFPKIEKEMKRIISSGDEIRKITNIKKLNKYQKSIIETNKNLIAIEIGKDFTNLVDKNICTNVNQIKFFKLITIGGSIFKIKTKTYSTTRIYGVCFSTKEELEKFEAFALEQRERDHRKIGSELKIFTFDELIGQGLPIWLPNGEIIKNSIKNFLIQLFLDHKFNLVDTPILGNKNLYIKSGHWDHYKENNFPPMKLDDEVYMLRPMTCPHHIAIYNQQHISYKQLPYLICENAKLHRYESSGGLIGLERVRAMELFDAHIFCDINQVDSVIFELNKMMKTVYDKLQINIDEIHLSLHDKKDFEKYHNDPKMWKKAEDKLREVCKKLEYKTKELEGEAAFYGPKIDFQYKTNLGKIITISTIQLDFLLPQRFECKYIDKNNEKQAPVLIHFGIVGTYERLLSALLSKTKGVLPFWLAPIQVIVIPVNNEFHLDYAKQICEQLKREKVRVTLEDTDERLSKKIRDSQTNKIPYQIIIGDNEIKNKKISYREYGKTDTAESNIDDLIQKIKNKL